MTSTLLRSTKTAVSRVANRRYGTARIFCKLAAKRLEVGDPILIYTVGKVGSTSVAKAVRASETKRQVHHVHWLTATKLADAERRYREGAKRYSGTERSRPFFQRHVWLGEYLSKEIAKDDNVWTVVTLVRDPVGRNISSFLQNLDSFFDFWLDDELEYREVDDVAQELVAMFLASYPLNSSELAIDGDPLVWFDEELRQVFDVDVYRSPFPTKVGYTTYSSGSANVLLIRLEDLDRVASQALSPFLGVRDVSVAHDNDTSAKAYAATYRRFRELLVIPEDYLERMYTSRYVTHFYTEAEIAAFRARW